MTSPPKNNSYRQHYPEDNLNTWAPSRIFFQLIVIGILTLTDGANSEQREGIRTLSAACLRSINATLNSVSEREERSAARFIHHSFLRLIGTLLNLNH